MKPCKNFCMAPWVHMSIWQTGDAYPCCIYDWQTPIGNINEGGLRAAWNSPDMKDLRLQLLNNEQPAGCSKCYDYEAQGIHSYRNKMNTDYKHHENLIYKTNTDGSLDNINLPYFDIRFSNLCNMKCRTCGPHFSSKWAEDTDGKPNIIEITNPSLWNEIEEILPSIEEIYFTGGESMFMEQHYRLLKMLIDNNHFPKLTYNSNASRLGLKNHHISDYWKHFDEINFYVSFDQISEKAEFTRHGQSWETIFENLCFIRDNFKQVKIQPNPTISVLNILDIADIVRFCFDNKFTYKYNMNLNNLLVTPEYYSCTILPNHLKVKAEERIIKLIKELDNYNEMSSETRNTLISQLEGIVQFMNNKDNSAQIPVFKETMKKIDKLRNENFTTIFPELQELYA